MLGYIVNTKFGAMVYNIGHHRRLASVMYISGAAVGMHWLMLAGIIIFAHACMDRIFGFGMKYNDSFKHTYLDDLERKIS